MEDGVLHQIDSYFGDVRDTDNHDRFTTNVDTGEITGHGFNHEKW